MEVMIRTIPMPSSVLTTILSQLAHVACGISDANTVKNNRHPVALKLLQNLRDIIDHEHSVVCGNVVERNRGNAIERATRGTTCRWRA